MLLARFLCFALLVTSAARSDDISKPLHLVRASGEATIPAQPDRVQIAIGVITNAPTAQLASSQNATQTGQLLDSLKHTLNSRGQLKTASYSLSPVYEYANGKPAKLVGYKAENTVLVTLDDLSLAGTIVDDSTTNGANTVNGITFSLRNDEAVRSQALAAAAAKARANAEAIAHALNLQIVGIVDAESSEAAPPRPRPQAFMGDALAQRQTSFEPGTLDVHASVIVTLEVR